MYNTIRLKFDTAQILKANDSIYSYHPYGADTSRLKLSKEENLVDSEDSTFVIRFNNKTDQLIMKNIRNGGRLICQSIEIMYNAEVACKCLERFVARSSAML